MSFNAAEYMRQYRKRHKQKINEQRREWYAENSEDYNQNRYQRGKQIVAGRRDKVPSGIKERIKELRLRAGLSQAVLSQKIQTHISTVQGWEHGISVPSASTLNSLAKVLKVSTDYILTGGENPQYSAVLRAIRASGTQDQRLLAFLQQSGEQS